MPSGTIQRKGPRPASEGFEALQPTIKSMNRPLKVHQPSQPQSAGTEGGDQLYHHLHNSGGLDWSEGISNTPDEFGDQSMSSTPEDFEVDFYNNSMFVNDVSSPPSGTHQDFQVDIYNSSVPGYDASSSPHGLPETSKAASYNNSMSMNDVSAVPAQLTRVGPPLLDSYSSDPAEYYLTARLFNQFPMSAHPFVLSQQQAQHGATYSSANENLLGSINGTSYGGVLATTNSNHIQQYSLPSPPKVVAQPRSLPGKENRPALHSLFPPTPSPYSSPYPLVTAIDPLAVPKHPLPNAFPFRHHIETVRADEQTYLRVCTAAQAKQGQMLCDIPDSKQSQVEETSAPGVHTVAQANQSQTPHEVPRSKHSPMEEQFLPSLNTKASAVRTQKPCNTAKDGFGAGAATTMSDATRICQVLAAAKEAGFDCLEDVLVKLYTAGFTGYSKSAVTCRQEQVLGWGGRVETLIDSLMTSTTNPTPESYERAILKAATPLFKKEFESLFEARSILQLQFRWSFDESIPDYARQTRPLCGLEFHHAKFPCQ